MTVTEPSGFVFSHSLENHSGRRTRIRTVTRQGRDGRAQTPCRELCSDHVPGAPVAPWDHNPSLSAAGEAGTCPSCGQAAVPALFQLPTPSKTQIPGQLQLALVLLPVFQQETPHRDAREALHGWDWAADVPAALGPDWEGAGMVELSPVRVDQSGFIAVT